MAQPILLRWSRRGKASVLLHDRDARLDAPITNIHGRAGHKPLHLVGRSTAERAAKPWSAAQQSRDGGKLPSHAPIPTIRAGTKPRGTRS